MYVTAPLRGMNDGVKIALWVIAGIVVFWVVLQIVSAIFSFVTWLISLAITLGIIAVLLYLAYFVVSKVIGGGGTTSSTDRERIFE